MCDSVHRGGMSASVHAGIPPSREQTPPLGAETPPKSSPSSPPPQEQTPSPRADPPSGGYASYWNAFLFTRKNPIKKATIPKLLWPFLKGGGGMNTRVSEHGTPVTFNSSSNNSRTTSKQQTHKIPVYSLCFTVFAAACFLSVYTV